MSSIYELEILSEPFGPYLDSEILSKDCKTTAVTSRVELTNVMLSCEGEPTGLTYTEPGQPESDKLCAEKYGGKGIPTTMRGTLEVQTLKWLSKNGQKLILHELRQRDVRSRRRRRGGAVEPSNLTLAHIFDSTSGRLRNKKNTLSVIIQASKNSCVAVYLSSTEVPDALLLSTEDSHRTYKVLTMDCETYTRSRLYLSRYNVYHVLSRIVELDVERGSKPTPLNQRTLEWFVLQYIDNLAYPEDDFHRRPIFHPHDRDVDPEKQDGTLLPRKKHHPRHISRAEVRSLFAMHFQWIVLEQKRRRFTKVFDPEVWILESPNIMKWREEAAKQGYSWGVYRWGDDFETNYEDYADFLDIDIYAPPKQSKKKKSPHATSLLAVSAHPTRSSTTTTLPSRASSYDPYYDSDFTDDAVDHNDEWDNDSFDGTVDPVVEGTNAIPRVLLDPPQISDQSTCWDCPVQDCLYEVDFRMLSDEQMNIIGVDKVDEISSSRWAWENPTFRVCIKKIISAHYSDHLLRLGVELVQNENKPHSEYKSLFGLTRSRKEESARSSSEPEVKEEIASQEV